MSETVVVDKALNIQYGEVKSFTDAQVHFKAVITCEGKLEFTNCTLHYNEYRFPNGILLDNESVLSFKNCEIICEGSDEEAFIRGDSCEQVTFDGCTFKNCSKFLAVSDDEVTKNFSMLHCQIINCFDEFVHVRLAEDATCSITDTEIVENAIAGFNNEDGRFYSLATLINVASQGAKLNCLLANNKIQETEGFKRSGVKPGRSDNEIRFFVVENAKIQHCSFTSVHNCLILENSEVTDCEFDTCDNILLSDNCSPERHLSVMNCKFQNCTRIISCGLNTNISKCTFTACHDKLILPGIYDCGGTKISGCTFKGVQYLSAEKEEDITSIMPASLSSEDSKKFYGVDACITFSCNDEDSKPNQISHCSFEDVELGKDVFLIQSVGNVEYDALEINLHRHKPFGTVAYIKDCQFSRVTTRRKTGKIIKEYVQYDTIFNKGQNFLANVILDCAGLDEVQVAAKPKETK